MKKTTLAIIGTIILIVAVVLGCVFLSQKNNTNTATPNSNIADNTNNNTEQNIDENKSQKSSTVTIEELKNALENSGYVITNEITKSAELIGGKEGIGLEINGKFIEVYDFDLNSNEELTKSNVKSAKDNGKIIMPSFGNYELNAKINKNLILVSYDSHPDKDGILEVFNSL